MTKRTHRTRTVNINLPVLDNLKRTFSIRDEEVETFLTTLLEKTIQDYIADENAAVLSNVETKELEEDLKGLGYI